MKTQEQQKAELCDKLIEVLKLAHEGCENRTWKGFQNGDGEEFGEQLDLLMTEYDSITAQKPLTADPYADEVFSGRVLNKVQSYFYRKGLGRNPRLSECPHISYFGIGNGFGRKSREEYIEVMKKFNMHDKI
jgi:hypothetical protein